MYGHLRKAIKKPQQECKCLINRRHYKLFGVRSKTKRQEHRANCYLHSSKVYEDLVPAERNHWELLATEATKAPWYKTGKYVLHPEGLIIQIWYALSNICFFCSIFNICSHMAFSLRTVNSE